MKQLKALEILKFMKMSSDSDVSVLNEAIAELEALEIRSCINCNTYKGSIKKDCKTLAYEFNQQLKVNGYLINESEFYCSKHKVKE